MTAKSPNSDLDPMLLDLFRVELENNTRVLENGLVSAEREQVPEKIEPLMRAAHSIKGAARIVGLSTAVSLAHAMEDVLSAAQQGKLHLTPGHVDMLLKGNDQYISLSRIDTDSIFGWLEERSTFLDEMARNLRNSLSGKTALVPTEPPVHTPEQIPASPGPVPCGDRQTTVPSSRRETDRVQLRKSRTTAKGESSLVRVMTEHMDRLMGLAGECLVQSRFIKDFYPDLLKIRQSFPALTSGLEGLLQSPDITVNPDIRARLQDTLKEVERIQGLASDHTVDFELSSRRLENLTNRLYDEVVASRMQPFGDGLRGFSRLVRELSGEMHKQVRFEILGEKTPVDREILEKLEAPLSHLVRNALDHGLETSAERELAGKSPEGTLTVEARHVAGMLSITVQDDGRGISSELLRGMVVQKGLVNPDMAGSLTRTELLEFLFLPGFSTAAEVSELSGRGVGLDVVSSMVHEVGGSVRIESQEKDGTRFMLLLPLTLSVLRTLLIEIDKEKYAMPLTRIERILSVPHTDLHVVENRQFYALNGENIGIVDARQLFLLEERPDGAALCHILVFSDKLNRFGLAVDHFDGLRDLVVHPLDARLGKIANISAGAIMEGGAPVLILDMDDLVRSIDHLLTKGSLRRVGGSKTEMTNPLKRILVVDDSLTVREVERKLLETHGYEVSVAVDGMDGWNKLQGDTFALVVSDIDMPRLNGIDLVRRIKTSPLLKTVPVMIVSYKDREEDRLRGLEAGANYYLTKSSFHDETLLQAVRDLIGEP